MSIGGIEAFGIFTGAFGLFTFGLDKLPKDPPPGGTKVAIKIGDPGADKADESTVSVIVQDARIEIEADP